MYRTLILLLLLLLYAAVPRDEAQDSIQQPSIIMWIHKNNLKLIKNFRVTLIITADLKIPWPLKYGGQEESKRERECQIM